MTSLASGPDQIGLNGEIIQFSTCKLHKNGTQLRNFLWWTDRPRSLLCPCATISLLIQFCMNMLHFSECKFSRSKVLSSRTLCLHLYLTHSVHMSLGVLSVLIQHTHIVMECFGEIFMRPASPNPKYDPRENMVRQIQDMDETERRSNCTPNNS